MRGLLELGLQLVLQQGGWDLQPVSPGWGIYNDCHNEEDGGFTTGVGVGGFHNTGRMLSGTRFIVKGCHRGSDVRLVAAPC